MGIRRRPSAAFKKKEKLSQTAFLNAVTQHKHEYALWSCLLFPLFSMSCIRLIRRHNEVVIECPSSTVIAAGAEEES